MYPNWTEEFNSAVTVCDAEGIILYMNEKAAKTFAKDGGKALVGTNLLNCHSPRSRDILADMLKNQKKNVYTIEKNGIKKIIYQSPWYENGEYKGFVELSHEIPFEMEHFKRD